MIPETVDCIGPLAGLEPSGAASIVKTDRALGVTKTFFPATTQRLPHLGGAGVSHPDIETVRAGHAEFRAVGFKGSEEPTEP